MSCTLSFSLTNGDISMKNIAIGGSRNLSADWLPTVRRVVAASVATGHHISVGCCVGADEYVLEASLDIPVVSGVTCFTIADCAGDHACGLTALESVTRFARAGGSVVYSAGGGPDINLKARLVRRTGSVFRLADTAAVLFFGDSGSVGTVNAGRIAVSKGLPVVGFGAKRLPSLGSGLWVPCGKSGVWASALSWVPNASLF